MSLYMSLYIFFIFIFMCSDCIVIKSFLFRCACFVTSTTCCICFLYSLELTPNHTLCISPAISVYIVPPSGNLFELKEWFNFIHIWPMWDEAMSFLRASGTFAPDVRSHENAKKFRWNWSKTWEDLPPRAKTRVARNAKPLNRGKLEIARWKYRSPFGASVATAVVTERNTRSVFPPFVRCSQLSDRENTAFSLTAGPSVSNQSGRPRKAPGRIPYRHELRGERGRLARPRRCVRDGRAPGGCLRPLWHRCGETR